MKKKGKEIRKKRRKGIDKIRTGKRKMAIKGGVKKYSCKERGTGKREIEKAQEISDRKFK